MISSRANIVPKNNAILKEKTAQSFGFEWTVFNQLKSEKGFLEFIGPIIKSFFQNKRVLDAGCGNGSYAYYAAHYGAEVIAMDFSDSVYVARKNTKDLNVQVIRADIYHLPFKDQSFDYIFSIGVLHHLPEPKKGFDYLVPLLKTGALISIWVYGKKGQRAALYVYEPIIKISHRLPHKFLYYLCYIPAMIMEIINRLYRILIKIRLNIIASVLPFKYYAEYPFSTKLNDSFDVFATPTAQYFTEEEILNWFSYKKFSNISVTTAGVAKGIKGFGIKK